MIRQDPWISVKGSINVKNIIGRKVGMTSVFTEDGRSVPVTVIQAGPCTVVQKKTKETDGYEAVALAFGDIKPSRLTKALQGHYKKAGLAPKRDIREFRTGIDGIELGATVTVDGFAQGDRVDVQGISKGHGFAGGIKRHNFSGGGASHGSMIHRQPGSNGDTNAGHTPKGSRRPGHYGVDKITHQNLEVVRADTERNLLLVRGPVPGPKNGLVIVQQSVKTKVSA
ncbi:MAG: 50S ribosomal protein L3 [Candidatus Eremiobacteraeota bacterium]|nr:50S ribosomal protein L3 [Candidatus Eremiobacteraeota bacterium]